MITLYVPMVHYRFGDTYTAEGEPQAYRSELEAFNIAKAATNGNTDCTPEVIQVWFDE